MSNWSNQTKHNATASNLSKNISTFYCRIRSGFGWLYNQFNYTYNQATDPDGDVVYYNAVGVATPWANQSKS